MARNTVIDGVVEQTTNDDADTTQQSADESEQCISRYEGRECTSPVCVTDGGQPTAREVLEQCTYVDVDSAEEVEYYPNESVEVAYHGSDEHVIATAVDNTDDIEIERVPATRTAVLKEEKLWTIPSNWYVGAKIREDGTESLLCHIPEGGNVVVECPSSESSTVSRYEVSKLGRVKYDLVDIPKAKRMHQAHDKVEGQANAETGLLQALEELAIRWRDFVWQYQAHFEKRGDKAVKEIINGDDLAVLDSWVLNPWDDEQTFSHLLPDHQCIQSHAEEISEIMVEAGVVSLYPRVEITVSNWRRYPVGYQMKALIELGCTPTEAVDYLLIEQRRKSPEWARSPISPWADTRGVTEATIRNNIAAVEKRLNQ